jgi:hypothetical protein
VLIRFTSCYSRARRAALCAILLFAPAVFLLTGCGKLHPPHKEMLYVSARETFLRDRVAAVSNRTGQVTNGEALEVLEHGRRFTRVKTPKNEVGWIEDHMVIDQKIYDAFQKLAEDHKQDQPFATATLRDDLYMHVTPGRETDHFYLLAGNAKVQLLERASVERPPVGGAAPAPLAKLAQTSEKNEAAGQATAPAPPPMEDWWLVRDAQGRTGWLLASRVDVDVPETIEQYGEGQRFVGAWQIATVHDPDSEGPNHDIPEYLTLMAPPKSGLPFDFDQVRVFTWSRIHHRYETGFRLHPIAGYLPVKIFTASTPQGTVPAFSFVLAGNENVITDPDTGVMRPASPRTIEYQMIETQVKRIGADTAPIPTRHEEGAEQKAGKKEQKKARRH